MKEQIIAWSDQADEHADKTLQCKCEFHPDWHEVRDAYFATLVRNAALEEVAALGRVGDRVKNPAIVEFVGEIYELKEPTP